MKRKCANFADSCIDLHLLQGGDELRMHQTVARFVCQTKPSPQQRVLLVKIRQAQARRLTDIAKQVTTNPARTDLAAVMLLFLLTSARWEERGTTISVPDGEVIGRALFEIGRFNGASSWYERVVKENEQGDVHGRVDHASLGRSLHQVGSCLSRVGEARGGSPGMSAR